MQTGEQLRWLTLDLFDQLKKENVVYAEIRFALYRGGEEKGVGREIEGGVWGLRFGKSVELVNGSIGGNPSSVEKFRQAIFRIALLQNNGQISLAYKYSTWSAKKRTYNFLPFNSLVTAYLKPDILFSRYEALQFFSLDLH